MKHLLWAAAFALGLSIPLSAAHAGACNDPGSQKKSSVANVGAATTTSITPASGNTGERTFICHIVASLAGTTPSIIFKYGSGTDCATAAVSISGTILPTTGSMIRLGYGDDVFVIPPGNNLCGTTAGASSSFQGIVTYVQK